MRHLPTPMLLRPSRCGGMLPIIGLIMLLLLGGIFAYNHFQSDREEFELRRAHRALMLRHTQTLEEFENKLRIQKHIQTDIETELALASAQPQADSQRLAFLQQSRDNTLNEQMKLRADYHDILSRIEQELNRVIEALDERGLRAP